MLDQIEVKGVGELAIRSDEQIKCLVRGVGPEPWVKESQAQSDAVNVSIDGHGGPSHAEEQHTGGGLRADPGQFHQPIAGFRQG